MPAVETTVGTEDLGRLANRGMAVKSLQAALGRAETNLDVIPRLVGRVIREEAWRHWIDGDHGEFKPTDFRLFLTAPKPAGCGAQLPVIERALKGTDAWEPYLEAIRGRPGNPTGANQWSNGNRNIVTVSISPTSTPEVIPLPRRDYSREAKSGNSVSYAVRRLRKHRPELYERVKAGEMTAHRAMVEAGFVERSITIPDDPSTAARRLLRHFQGERLEALIAALSGGLPRRLT